MNTSDIEFYLQDIILNEMEDLQSVMTYEEAGIMTSDNGLVMTMDDGSEYQITIVKSK